MNGRWILWFQTLSGFVPSKKALNSIESVSFKLGGVFAGETAYSQHFPFHFILSLDILD